MSNELAHKLKEASGLPATDSVFDFLYHDPQRIGSFLGQLDPSGVAQSLRRTDQTNRGLTDQSDDGLKVSAGLLSGQIGARTATSESAMQGAERTYDPLWTNARAFLDYLAQRDMIHRDVYSSRIGQFVLMKGTLSIVDVAMLKEGWKLPTFRRAAGVPLAPAKPVKNRSASDPDVNAIEFAFEMLGILPHSVQAVVASPSATVWSNLRAECLATSSGDLLLKHGLVIPGEWSVLGILDAQPDIVSEDSDTVFAPDGTQMAAQLMTLFAPLTRRLLGRPEEAFGVTPLMIFREASG